MTAVQVLEMCLTLLKNMCVIVVLAYVLTRTEFFSEVLAGRFTLRSRVLLVAVFGLFSIYGTLSGIEIMGAVANIRDLGPAIAGLVGGPLAGLGAGVIGGAHRFTLGGITGTSCAVSTVLAGLAGGLVYRFAGNRRIGMRGAVLFALAMELAHLGIVLLLARPFQTASTIVAQVAAPMVIANTFGLGIFFYIVDNLVRERETEAAKRVMEGELKVAREIQMGIIPKIFPAFPDRPEFDIYATLIPAKEVGGDLYDFFEIDDERLFFVIGDVSGKGVPASLFMTITMTLFRAGTGKQATPDRVMGIVNDQLSRDNDASMFVTAFCGIFNTRTGEVHYANGGHNLPVVMRADGRLEVLPRSGGVVLGAMEDMSFNMNSLRLNPGDALFMYTDGVTEAMNACEELYSDGRLLETLSGLIRKDARRTVLGVVENVNGYCEGVPQTDDITAMMLRFNGPS